MTITDHDESVQGDKPKSVTIEEMIQWAVDNGYAKSLWDARQKLKAMKHENSPAPVEPARRDWRDMNSAPKNETVFVCRDKRKPHVTFEAALFWEQESWEIPQKYLVCQNMTTEEPIDIDFEYLEWMPVEEAALTQPPAPDLEKIAEKIEGLRKSHPPRESLDNHRHRNYYENGVVDGANNTVDAVLELIKQAGRGRG